MLSITAFPKLWVATHWWVAKHIVVGREGFVSRLTIRPGIPSRLIKCPGKRAEVMTFFFSHQLEIAGDRHLRQSKVGRELIEFGNHLSIALSCLICLLLNCSLSNYL